MKQVVIDTHAAQEPKFSIESTIVASSKAPNILPIERINPVESFLTSLAHTSEPTTSFFVRPMFHTQPTNEDHEFVEDFEHLFMTQPDSMGSKVKDDPIDPPSPRQDQQSFPRNDTTKQNG
jgi:hypothetical protein